MKKISFNKNHNKWFLSGVRTLIDAHSLINQGEKIGFALSGGKDSITLLYILSYLKKFSNMDFELVPIHIKTGDYNTDLLKNFCEELHLPYLEEKISLPQNQKNVCYFCSKHRRMLIKDALYRRQITKVVYAHNKNDVLETFLMNLSLHKRIETISPKSCSENFCVVRPMLDLDKKTINALHKYFDLPLLEYKCKFEKDNIREQFRIWIENQNDKIFKDILANITEAFYL